MNRVRRPLRIVDWKHGRLRMPLPRDVCATRFRSNEIPRPRDENDGHQRVSLNHVVHSVHVLYVCPYIYIYIYIRATPVKSVNRSK